MDEMGCAPNHVVVCVQLELPGIIGEQLEMCRGTLTFCRCPVLCFIYCIADTDPKCIVHQLAY